jgi:flagellar hook-length control protein FliK
MLSMPPPSPTFGPALGQQIEMWMRNGVQHAEVQLSPQDLGPITVRIAVDGAQTRVEMTANVASTRDALQQALPQLSDSLGQVGLSLSGGSVSDQSAAQSQEQRKSPGDGGFGAMARAGALGSLGAGDDGDDGDALRLASAARQASQRRGLLDLYA